MIAGKTLRVVLVVVLAVVAVRVADSLLGRMFRRPPGMGRWKMDDGRARTMNSLLRSVLHYTVGVFAVLMLLDILGVDTRSLLGGVAVVGLAVGFGAQNLVRDVISGFFILYENQFTVGDYIKVAGVSGVVEELGLRATKLRDWSGEVHVIPNGLIDTTTNMSRAGSRALVEVSVAYEADIRRAMEVMEKECEAIAREMSTILEGPKVLGVKELANSAVVIQVWARTQPLEQWEVERVLRLRLKEALDAAGIEIPYPRLVVYPPPAPPTRESHPEPGPGTEESGDRS